MLSEHVNDGDGHPSKPLNDDELILPERGWRNSVARHSCARGGWISVMEISVTHLALFCETCNFRLVVPKTVKAWGDLREHMRNELMPRHVQCDCPNCAEEHCHSVSD